MAKAMVVCVKNVLRNVCWPTWLYNVSVLIN